MQLNLRLSLCLPAGAKRWARVLAWTAWACVATPAIAQAVAEDATQDLRWMADRARVDFQVPANLGLGPALQERLQALVREHHLRLDAAAATWLREWSAPGQAPEAPLPQMLWARYFNELVLWQIDRADAVDDSRLLQAYRHAGLCGSPLAGRPFGLWLAMLQRLPEPEREAAVRAQETLLARWGQPRAELPERPAEPWLNTARTALQSLRAATRPEGEPPAPPSLVWTYLIAKPSTLALADRCALAVWMIQREPLASAPAAVRAGQLRLALAWDIQHDLPLPKASADTEAPGATSDYPPQARRFGVEGDVVVSGLVPPSGKGLDRPVVAERRLQVPGLGNTRAAAFETLLDEASLRLAQRGRAANKLPGQAASITINWRLD